MLKKLKIFLNQFLVNKIFYNRNRKLEKQIFFVNEQKETATIGTVSYDSSKCLQSLNELTYFIWFVANKITIIIKHFLNGKLLNKNYF